MFPLVLHFWPALAGFIVAVFLALPIGLVFHVLSPVLLGTATLIAFAGFASAPSSALGSGAAGAGAGFALIAVIVALSVLT